MPQVLTHDYTRTMMQCIGRFCFAASMPKKYMEDIRQAHRELTKCRSEIDELNE